MIGRRAMAQLRGERPVERTYYRAKSSILRRLRHGPFGGRRSGVWIVAGLMLVVGCASPRLPMERKPSSTEPWACAAAPPVASASPSLFALQSVWPKGRPTPGEFWGDEPAERGPTQLLRLDPGTGATLAHDAGQGAGVAADPGGQLVARLGVLFPDPANPMVLPKFAGIELLASDTLLPVAVLQPAPSLFADQESALRSATIALASTDHVLVVYGVNTGYAQEHRGPLGIHATCLDRAQPSRAVAQVMLSDAHDGLSSCNTRPLVAPGRDGAWFVLYDLCAVYPAHGALRLFHIDPQAQVTQSDLPFWEYEVPAAFSADGRQVFVADPRLQELYSVDTATGKVRWQQPYGVRPPATPQKLIDAPNQLVLSPDGTRLYLISNWQHVPSPGLWVIDAHTGKDLAHTLANVGLTGLALAPNGDVFVVSPQDGGRLWVLPGGDPAQPRLLRKDLGPQVSDIVIGT